jgi:hypothetical protein
MSFDLFAQPRQFGIAVPVPFGLLRDAGFPRLRFGPRTGGIRHVVINLHIRRLA